MNNPWLGLSKELVYRPGDALEEKPVPLAHLINDSTHSRRGAAKQTEPADGVVRHSIGAPRGPRMPAVANPWGLSGAQCAVMAHLVEGHTNKEIGELLHIAEKTVELHLHNCRKAMGVNKALMAALAWDRFHRPATPHPAETAQPLAGNGDQP